LVDVLTRWKRSADFPYLKGTEHGHKIPFTTFSGFLKQHAQQKLDTLEQELFDFLFPRFQDDNEAHKAYEKWKSDKLIVPL